MTKKQTNKQAKQNNTNKTRLKPKIKTKPIVVRADRPSQVGSVDLEGKVTIKHDFFWGGEGGKVIFFFKIFSHFLLSEFSSKTDDFK